MAEFRSGGQRSATRGAGGARQGSAAARAKLSGGLSAARRAWRGHRRRNLAPVTTLPVSRGVLSAGLRDSLDRFLGLPVVARLAHDIGLRDDTHERATL